MLKNLHWMHSIRVIGYVFLYVYLYTYMYNCIWVGIWIYISSLFHAKHSLYVFLCEAFLVCFSMRSIPCSLFLVPCSLFLVPCSLFLVPCSYSSKAAKWFLVPCPLSIDTCVNGFSSAIHWHKCQWFQYRYPLAFGQRPLHLNQGIQLRLYF